MTDEDLIGANDTAKSLGYYVFFFNDTATTEIYTLSLHDALPISALKTRYQNLQGNGELYSPMQIIGGCSFWL